MSRINNNFFGESFLIDNTREVQGSFVTLENDRYYKISNVDQMPPFFISVVSNSDHWLYVSSKGGLTCGRQSPDQALFPYETDDKIHENSYYTGPRTEMLVHSDDKKLFWTPFQTDSLRVYDVEQNLYKSIQGNKLLFEEINHSLKLRFRYTWMTSAKYGFVRSSEIKNLDPQHDLNIDIIDGLQNILPYGITRALQANLSTLVDGYKKSEIERDTGLGIFALSSILTDRAEPSEALKATIVYGQAAVDVTHYLSRDVFQSFRRGDKPAGESHLHGRKGGYFMGMSLKIKSCEKQDWNIIADVNYGPARVANLQKSLQQNKITKEMVCQSIVDDNQSLREKVASADGIQCTGDEHNTVRHFSNVMFNIMRGGIFAHGYQIEGDDFVDFVQSWNKSIYSQHKHFFLELKGKEISQNQLLSLLSEKGNQLVRLGLEYLPLSFSRRHGDPSRPWNVFNIQLQDEHGNERLNYQGNWRDIFQNWEALAFSFPGFLESIIVKFLNASTIDGYNPYRVTRDGIDWELFDPEDPWSNIGYWGDHQIIYLTRLLELYNNFYPEKINNLWHHQVGVFANVPYRIKSYREIKEDVYNTIDFDDKEQKQIDARVKQMGGDGKLLMDAAGQILTVSLLEKILIPVLAKLSNFIPDAGIWMNTQRPEWNDANNALVGNGVSVVTLASLHRHIHFLIETLKNVEASSVSMLLPVVEFLNDEYDVFSTHEQELKGEFSPHRRKEFVDQLGEAGTRYRQKIYQPLDNTNKQELDIVRIVAFFQLALTYIKQSLKNAKRKDGLYHAYNLIKFQEDKVMVEHLQEMLEGQVAVLSSGFLSEDKALNLIQTLSKTALFREDQHSYLLYPDQKLPRFLEKNKVDKSSADNIVLTDILVKDKNNPVFEQDDEENIYFKGDLRNANDLSEALNSLSNQPELKKIVTASRKPLLDLYEQTFHHRKFTGRSGTFYKYEGLGCIYWHMVSKLGLAVREIYHESSESGKSQELMHAYKEIKSGIGVHKHPMKYGAFPTDPYSHTPGFAGVQQPGMTGQVKEDILSRWSELGLRVRKGQVSFYPEWVDDSDWLKNTESFQFTLRNGSVLNTQIEKNCLAYTFNRIPVIYKNEGIGKPKIIIYRFDGSHVEIPSRILNIEWSQSIFQQKDEIKFLEVII